MKGNHQIYITALAEKKLSCIATKKKGELQRKKTKKKVKKVSIANCAALQIELHCK